MTRPPLLFVTQWFPPEPVTVPLWISNALARRGWEVEVLTAHPNYPTGKIQPGHTASRFVSGTQNGFRVNRTPVYPSHDTSAARRMTNYLSWAVSASVVAPWKSRRRGVTLVYSSPATAALPAMVARLLVARPYVLQVQDVWPDSVSATGLLDGKTGARIIQSILTRFVDLSYRLAHTVVVISPGAKTLLIERGVPEGKVHLIHNWADESVMHPVPRHGDLREQLGLDGESLVLMYAGAMGPAQALETAIDAVGRASSRTHLVFLGDGVSRQSLRVRAAHAAPGRVHFLDPVPVTEIAHAMAGADAQLVSLADLPLFTLTLPSKIQGILATGSLCIASVPGDAAKIVTEAGGISVRPGDVDALTRAVDDVASLDEVSRARRRTQAEQYYRARLSEQTGASRLVQILEQAANGQNG